MQRKYTQSGQSLIEILFALALFVVSVSTIVFLILDAQLSVQYSLEMTQASVLAVEGLHAVQTIKSQSFSKIQPGTFGLVHAGDTWSFASSSDVVGIYTRAVGITEIDSELMRVESTVTWDTQTSRSGSIVLTTHLSNWEQTNGQARDFEYDTASVYLTASGTRVENISLNNGTSSPITITHMHLQWSGSALLEEIELNTTSVFTTGSSSGIVSDIEVDTVDYAVIGGAEALFSRLEFSQDMSGEDLVLSVKIADGSYKHAVINGL